LVALERSLILHQQRLSKGNDENSTLTGFELVHDHNQTPFQSQSSAPSTPLASFSYGR
jgi:hypothetical protein